MKKGMAGVLLLLLFLVRADVQGVFAWLTGSDEQHNHFTTGQNDVDIEEEFPDPEIVPGKTMKKKVEFTNTGTIPCYVRARYYFSTSEAEEQTEVMFGEEGWQEEADGYYYYRESILPGEKTKPFLTAVKILENGSFSDGFELMLYTETVQSENHETPQEAFACLKR